MSKKPVVLSWYTVKDLEAAKKFFGETLGMEKIFEMPGWAEFSHQQGGVALGLAQQREHGGGFPGATVVLGVQDIVQEMKTLAARGVKFLGSVEEIPGVVKLATFEDSSGNVLQLAQSLLESKRP